MISKIMISAVIAVIIESVIMAVFVCSGGIGAEGAANVKAGIIFIILHYPGILLADAMCFRGIGVVIVFTGFLQYFVVVFLVVEIRSRRAVFNGPIPVRQDTRIK